MPALLENADPRSVSFWNDRLVRDEWAGESAMAAKVAKEARLVLGRIQSSLFWRQLLASTTALWASAAPRYLDPDSDEVGIREYFASQNFDLDELLDAASAHFDSPGIHRPTAPLNADELEKLIEDDERSIRG